jgi:hypothetical protein
MCAYLDEFPKGASAVAAQARSWCHGRVLIFGGWLAYQRVRLLPIFWDVSTTVLTAQAEQALKPGRAFKECASCPELVVLQAGSFTME